MTFTHPWVLAGLAVVVPLVLVIGRRGFRVVPAAQHRWAVRLRVTAVSLLVVALAGPHVVLPVHRTSVLFVVDRSASVGPSGVAAGERFVHDALDAATGDEWSGVLVFGADARVDQALATGRVPAAITARVDESATDLAGALRSAMALLPSEGSRRIVVVSDTAETVGDARVVVDELVAAGIAVDVVALDPSTVADAMVTRIEAPATARLGDLIPVTVGIESTMRGEAVLTVDDGSGNPVSVPVTLEPGTAEVSLTVEATETGFVHLDAVLRTPGDTRPQNDRAGALVRVLGPGRVLVVEGAPGAGDALRAALEAGGVPVDVRQSIPDDDTLAAVDALVLVNVPAPTDAEAASLTGFVEDLGRGLVVVGGDRAFGMGDYADSGIEALLPVSSDPDDLIRRRPVAQVLAIDTSGSMAACHCDDPIMGHPDDASSAGVNKTDLSRAGAALAIEALGDQDLVGVVAFGSGTDWVLPLDHKPDAAAAEAALGTLFPDGNTEIAAGLEAAREALAGVDTDLRHIVLFTDGWDPNEAGLLPLTRQIAAEGITLSVLGTGEGAGTTLRRMATLGGGRYYPGADLASIPEIFVEETQTVARDLVQEGTFFPALAAATPVTDGLTEAPPLLGYVLTKSKGTATVGLEIGEGDPLLATWQRGLGRVTAWTSDAEARWASPWVTWDESVDFWGRVLRDVLPGDDQVAPLLRVGDGNLTVVAGPFPTHGDGTVTARVRTPDGDTRVTVLNAAPDGTFIGSLPAAVPGTYWVSVVGEVLGSESVLGTSGVVSGYSAEYGLQRPDPTLAAALADPTGGRVDPDPGGVFDDTERRGAAGVPIWPWLTLVALALFLVDVALRRLALGDGEVAVLSAVPVPEPPPAPPEPKTESAPPPTSETMARLLQRKRR